MALPTDGPIDGRSKGTSTDRRAFLRGAAATAASASVFAAPRAVHAAGSDVIRVGLIGCGGRGTGAAIDALHGDPQATLVALGDAFGDQAQSCLGTLRNDQEVGARVQVEDDAVFDGFDAFKKVVDAGVDVVILATPPHFRPEHLAYVVEKGKHCFVEKPVAVDVPGALRVQKICAEAASKGLSIVSGLCWRYDLGVRETVQRIQDGAIGDIIAIESRYNAGTLWHRERQDSWTDMEYQVRNWLYYCWLSGDHIVEQ
ncbi:MAG: Gfo/Idh/MocA family oxidoreductase, partial [Planctomycetales bacterium]|nr:Gfo/Idh/MocA family oxidoreductase [Planctomycetales bacterium]